MHIHFHEFSVIILYINVELNADQEAIVKPHQLKMSTTNWSEAKIKVWRDAFPLTPLVKSDYSRYLDFLSAPTLCSHLPRPCFTSSPDGFGPLRVNSTRRPERSSTRDQQSVKHRRLSGSSGSLEIRI